MSKKQKLVKKRLRAKDIPVSYDYIAMHGVVRNGGVQSAIVDRLKQWKQEDDFQARQEAIELFEDAMGTMPGVIAETVFYCAVHDVLEFIPNRILKELPIDDFGYKDYMPPADRDTVSVLMNSGNLHLIPKGARGIISLSVVNKVIKDKEDLGTGMKDIFNPQSLKFDKDLYDSLSLLSKRCLVKRWKKAGIKPRP